MPVLSVPLEQSAADRTLDVQGLDCPLPVLRTRIELRRMAPGNVLRVLATDPLATLDMRAFCAKSGHELLRSGEQDGVLEFLIRKGPGDMVRTGQ